MKNPPRRVFLSVWCIGPWLVMIGLCLPGFVLAGDTLRVMTYNLMYFGSSTTDCTPAVNLQSVKEAHLRTIIPYVRPHIIGFQEVGPSSAVTLSILNNVLNTAGESRWARANLMNPSGSSIVSILYYDNQKLGLSRQFPISSVVRDMMYYRLFHRQIPPSGDTLWLNVVVLHLKAGSTASDAATRAQETAALMSYFDQQNLNENILVMGDLNVGSSNELAYSQMVNHTQADHRLYDPINRPGTWNNNGSFAQWHTQSTRTSGTVCFSGGGLDDRFDQILLNRRVMGDSSGIRYIAGSYRSIGNDGQRFQGNVQSPFNASVPVAVANALYGISDHLPVVLDLHVNTSMGTSVEDTHGDGNLPCRCGPNVEGSLVCDWSGVSGGEWTGLYRWKILEPGGRVLKVGDWEVDLEQLRHKVDLHDLPDGLYFLQLKHVQSGGTKLVRHINSAGR
ncbi:MAG: endonuclease/exonuclease/phosphatase family protein [Bacteroidia bacterium]